MEGDTSCVLLLRSLRLCRYAHCRTFWRRREALTGAAALVIATCMKGWHVLGRETAKVVAISLPEPDLATSATPSPGHPNADSQLSSSTADERHPGV